HEKTSITHSEDGFDFLGQNVQRNRDGKVRLRPSRKSVRALLANVGEEIRQHGGHLTAGQLIQRLNPRIRGWARYHRHASNQDTFVKVDQQVFSKLWRWARRRHRHKTTAWVKRRYFTRLGRRDWVFSGAVTGEAGRPQQV